jgi:hypothetical protein
MPLTIHCTMCGANVVADDLEIRREIAVCSHCSTVLRITNKGTEAYREALQSAAVPEGVVVQRLKPGSLSIAARRTTKALAINRPELVQGTLIGLAISGGPLRTVDPHFRQGSDRVHYREPASDPYPRLIHRGLCIDLGPFLHAQNTSPAANG